ncbi:hypothetical protein Q8G71_34420, partial [Klebsiella pneumoniae]
GQSSSTFPVEQMVPGMGKGVCACADLVILQASPQQAFLRELKLRLEASFVCVLVCISFPVILFVPCGFFHNKTCCIKALGQYLSISY